MGERKGDKRQARQRVGLLLVYSNEASDLQLYFSKLNAVTISAYLVLHGFRIRIREQKGLGK